MKRLLSLLLVLALVIACAPVIPLQVNAETSNSCEEYLTWEIVDGEVTITDCDESISGDITIPATLGGYPVTCLGEFAFSNCSGLTSVIIPDGVVSISYALFYMCNKLASVTIPGSVTSIGENAFSYCSNLSSITIPDSVTDIGRFAFSGCSSLISIRIPNTITSIREYTFQDCTNLTEITLPDSLVYIGDLAFFDCSSLTKLTIPDSIIGVGESAFSQCTNLDYNHHNNGNYLGNQSNPYLVFVEALSATIASCQFHPDTKVIAPGALAGCSNLTDITIPDGVTYIPSYAFSSCTSLTDVIIPNSVTRIDGFAFQCCSSLRSITIPVSVIQIDNYAFRDCAGLTDVYYNGTEEQWSEITIGEYSGALSNATIHYAGEDKEEPTTPEMPPEDDNLCVDYLTWEIVDGEAIITDCDMSISGDVILPSTLDGYPVTEIGESAFEGCSGLTEIVIPDSVTTIGVAAFFECSSLTGIWVDENNTAYSSDAYGVLFNKEKTVLIQAPAGLTGAYTIEEGVASIGPSAFFGCIGLTSVTIEAELTAISDSMFMECSNLEAVNIPESVTVIGSNAFFYCLRLKSVHIPAGVTEIKSGAFMYCVGVPSFEIPDKVTAIANDTFYYCTGLTSFTIPEGVTSIGNTAFAQCSNLTSITIPQSVTDIADWAFASCDKLADVYYGGTQAQWEAITVGTNNGCLTDATIHFSEAESDNSCEAYLTWRIWSEKAIITDCDTSISGDVTIPATLDGYPVIRIDSSAFQDCEGLTGITMPDSVISIGDQAFYNCGSLTDVKIPDKVTTVGNFAFEYCTGLTSVTIGNRVTSIGNSAFKGCTNLTSVTMGNRVTNIGDAAFKDCSSLTSAMLPNRITSIGSSVFENCSSLASVKIPNSVTQILDCAFFGCSSLTSVTIPDSVTVLGKTVFGQCSKLTDVTIGTGISSISNYMFMGCTSLTEITIPDAITSIGKSAFQYCDKLTNVTIGNGVTSIDVQAFSWCTSLTEITIPEGATSIMAQAFEECKNLTNITIPISLSAIGQDAFNGCDSLANVYYFGTEEQKANIQVDYHYNTPLGSALWHYASCEYWEDGKDTATRFDTLEDALSAVNSGTVKLLSDATVNTAVLKPGVALDLNGYTLTADLLVAMNGATVIGNGTLKIAKENLMLDEDNGGFIPAWNGTDGYIFTEVSYQQMAREAGEGVVQYIFLPSFSNPEVAALLADGGMDNGIKVKVCLSWNNGQSQQFYTYDDAFVAQVFASGGKLAFSLTVTGIAGITDLTASAMVVTDSCAIATATGTNL